MDSNLEWNAGDMERDIFKYLLQFRSSGVRVKSSCSVPSLVLTGTQTPIIGWGKRYISLAEAQKFQGFESIEMPTSPAKAFAALGNAVNTKVVEQIAKQIVTKESTKPKMNSDPSFASSQVNAYS